MKLTETGTQRGNKKKLPVSTQNLKKVNFS